MSDFAKARICAVSWVASARRPGPSTDSAIALFSVLSSILERVMCCVERGVALSFTSVKLGTRRQKLWEVDGK